MSKAKSGERMISMPLGVVVRCAPGATRWAKWSWRATDVLPVAPPADWRELRREGETVDYHAATMPLELHRADAEAYMVSLTNDPPVVWVALRPAPQGVEVVAVTASAYEAQDFADDGETMVEPVPMPPGLIAWVRDFATAHHVEERFVKRKRDKKRIDLREDGKGDARIAQDADVYRSPASKRRRLQ